MLYPTKIKAVGINETGNVDVIQNLELPFPDVKPTDLLVKVHHLSLSSLYDEVRGSILSRRLNGPQLRRYLFQVTLGYLDQRCRLIPDYRSGLYQSRQRPLPIASEVSGTILELPSDPSVLENSD